MNSERAFLSKVALTGQIEQVLSDGINETHFEQTNQQDIFRYLIEHNMRYHAPPSLAVLRERYPDYNFEAPTDSLEYLTERFKKGVKYRFAHNSLLELARILDKSDGSEDIEGMFMEESRRLAGLMPTTKVHSWRDGIDNRIDDYEKGDFSATRGIKMGIPDFDRLTLGMHPKQYISFVGWQGTGKSTLAGYVAFQAFWQDAVTLVISLEMDWPELAGKWDTMLTNFEHRALRSGELSAGDLEKWRLKADEVRNRKGDIIVKDEVSSCTADYVYAETMRYKPDLVIIDYVSLMDTSRSAGSSMWEKVTYLTQSLKQIARTTGVPIIGIAQTNKDSSTGGAQLDNIAYSRSIGQDSDIVIGLSQDDDQKGENQMTLRMLKNRNGAPGVTDMLWKMDTMELKPWNEVEFFENQKRRREAEAARERDEGIEPIGTEPFLGGETVVVGEHEVNVESGEIVG